MREHPYVESPAYAVFDHSRSHERQLIDLEYNTTDSPSYLCPSGTVLWKTFSPSTGEISVKISYEELDWEGLRRDKGWEGTQFQALLRGNFTLPAGTRSYFGEESNIEVEVEIQLLRGLEFAIFARDGTYHSGLDEWYTGNIYGLASPSPSPTGSWHLPHRLTLRRRVEYVVLVKAIYEVRLFGDPGQGGPVIDFDFQIRPTRHSTIDDHSKRPAVEVLPGLGLIGDVLDGWILGEHVGIGLRGALPDQVVEIIQIKLVGEISDRLSVKMRPRRFRLVDTQARLFSFEISQERPLHLSTLEIAFSITYALDGTEGDREFEATLPLTHHTWKDRNETTAWKFIHTYPSSTLTYGMLLPPTDSLAAFSRRKDRDVTILALHGAGVQAHSRYWTDEIPRRAHGWAVVVTGGNEWGMDWHGISMEGSRIGLREARNLVAGLAGRFEWADDEWTMANETVSVTLSFFIGFPALKRSWGRRVMGHSNGGQGANHLAAHYPDEFVGCKPTFANQSRRMLADLVFSTSVVIQAAGYLKIQDYVSYNSWCAVDIQDRIKQPTLTG